MERLAGMKCLRRIEVEKRGKREKRSALMQEKIMKEVKQRKRVADRRWSKTCLQSFHIFCEYLLVIVESSCSAEIW